MNKLKEIYHSIFNTKVDGIGLAVFRVAYGFVLMAEIFQLFKFRHIIYDRNPFVSVGEIDVAFIFYFWFFIVGMLIFGFATRFTTIVNYLFSVIIFSSADQFEYHVFYAYVGINLMIIFMPISRLLSIDNLIKEVKYTGIGRPYKADRNVLEINYLILVFSVIALVYTDSMFFKVTSKMWMDGLGVWLPASLPMVSWENTSYILNSEFFSKVLGYIVMIFEAVFIFLFWFRKLRVPLLLIGIFFHLGILIVYPIPWFALTAVVVYLLLVPQSFWLWFAAKIKFKKQLFKFYYDAECPLCAKVVVVIRHIDIFNMINCLTVQGNYMDDPAIKSIDEDTLLINIHGVTVSDKVFVGYWAYVQLFKSLIFTYPIGLLLSIPGISHMGKKIYSYIAGDRLTVRCTEENCKLPVVNYPTEETQDVLIKGWNQLAITKIFWKLFFFFLILAQSLIIWTKPLLRTHIPKWHTLDKVIGYPYRQTEWFLTNYFGIVTHAVFMYDRHFEGYNHIFKIEYHNLEKKGLVPILDDEGMMTDSYLNGAFWVNYTFRVNSPKFSVGKFEKGILPYLRYFENDTQRGNTFVIYVKRIDTKDSWQKDFLNKQIEKPWVKVGTCKILNDTSQFVWNEKMQEIIHHENDEK